MIYRYWYDAETGIIDYRTPVTTQKQHDMPYFDKEGEVWNFSNWRIDVETGDLVPYDNPQGQGIDPRRPL